MRAFPWSLAAAVAAAFALRMVVVLFTYRDLPDANKYYEQFGWEMGWIARALASGHGFSSPYYPWTGPTAMQPPLYPGVAFAGLPRLRHLLADLRICHPHHQQSAVSLHLYSGLFQRQVFAWTGTCEGRSLVLGAVSIRNLFFGGAGVGVLADRFALHHFILHRAAHSSGWQRMGMAGLGCALRRHGAVKSLYPFHVALFAGDCVVAGAWFRPALVVKASSQSRPQ